MQTTLQRVAPLRLAPILAILFLVFLTAHRHPGDRRQPASTRATVRTRCDRYGHLRVQRRHRRDRGRWQRPPHAHCLHRRPMECRLVAPRRSDRVLVRAFDRRSCVTLGGSERWIEPAPGHGRGDVPRVRGPARADLVARRSAGSPSPPTGATCSSSMRTGTDLHRIGDSSHLRFDPVWSPDGTLIAYRGQPLSDPNSTTSSWVISPDGRTDMNVIPAEGGWEVANTNPSWSLDSRSILVDTGGQSEGGDVNISIAQRDAAGTWSHRTIVGGPTGDFFPSWSNSGTQFSFIRVVDGTNPEQYVPVTANADGSSVHEISSVRVGFGPECWSPDDRLHPRARSARYRRRQDDPPGPARRDAGGRGPCPG